MAKTQEKVEEFVAVPNENMNSEAVVLKDILTQLKTMQKEIDSLKKEKEVLQEKNNDLIKEIAVQNGKKNAIRSQDSEVTLYFNQYGCLEAHLPNLDLRMEQFGEERVITFAQFQQLIGKHRKFFERERLLVGPEDIDLVDKYKVKAYDPTSSSYIHYKDIEKFATMSGREIEVYFDKLSPKSKNGMLTLWMAKCYAKEPGFYSIEKMDALNRASGSKTFDLLIDELRRTTNK